LEAPNELAQNWKIARNLLSTYAKFAGPFLAHGDLKSENILVYNRELDVRFIDLGHAWPREGDEKLRTVLGCSPATTAPEIFASFSNVDVAKADIWSLGVVLFEIFTRLGPWGYADMSDPLYAYFRQCGKFAPGFAIDADVADLVAGCFAEDPAERPTVAELIQKAGPN
jgi:serine/threonine protein kinase